MNKLIMGIFAIILGIYWLRSIKREKGILFIGLYNGIPCVIFGILLIFVGIIEIFNL